MTLEDFRSLLEPTGQSCLRAATELDPTESQFLSAYTTLTKRFRSDLAKIALEQVLLRKKAAGKFAQSALMYFTREALEQATHQVVAAYRAERFQGIQSVADFGTGIGADAIALANVVPQVFAYENDELRAAIATENVRLREIPNIIVRQADLFSATDRFDAVYCDPARRAAGRRFLGIADYLPNPLEVVAKLPRGFPIGLKLAPGVDLSELESLGGEREFISLNNELKECTAWLGPLAREKRRATLLPSRATMSQQSPSQARDPEPISVWIYDPDPAISRGGLMEQLAKELEAWPTANSIGVLSSNTGTVTPFAKCYRVLRVLRDHPKHWPTQLRAEKIGPLTIIKQGTRLDCETLRKKLKLDGDHRRVLIVTQENDRDVACICDPLG